MIFRRIAKAIVSLNVNDGTSNRRLNMAVSTKIECDCQKRNVTSKTFSINYHDDTHVCMSWVTVTDGDSQKYERRTPVAKDWFNPDVEDNDRI
jgi:hypothetical protein